MISLTSENIFVYTCNEKSMCFVYKQSGNRRNSCVQLVVRSDWVPAQRDLIIHCCCKNWFDHRYDPHISSCLYLLIIDMKSEISNTVVCIY